MPYLKCASALLCAMSLAGPALHAQDPAPDTQPAPPAEPVWSVGPISFSGLIDGYYSKNFNNPASRVNQFRNFDVRANDFTLNMTQIRLQHEAAPVGFVLDLGYGRAWEVFHSTEPGGSFMSNVPQAYISFLAPDTKTQFDFGKFYTSAGAEPTETHLNWNYSRSLIYANGPYYHAGLRVSQPIGDNWTAGFQLLNGWNNLEDNNTGKTLGFTGGYTGKYFAWFNTYYTGPEKTDTNSGFRNFYDTVLSVTPNESVSAYLNFDYGTEKEIGGGSNDWIAVAGAARFALSKHWAVSPRLEWYYDKDGFITGDRQRIKEFTLTAEYKWAEGLLSRLEYRRDWSDVAVFERGAGGLYKSQNTLLVGVVAFFGPRR